MFADVRGARALPKVLRRGDPSYEAARRSSVWNGRVPDRYPAVIARASDVYDVVSAVRLAKREGLRVSVCSGGHSWAANHLRDGGLLIDCSGLDDVRVDVGARRALAGPGCAGDRLDARLARDGLFFPVGHCEGVCIGGYLLQGGFGWHGRALGLACESVEALDLVTADGDVVHASERENADLYWAARGAGPGFFAVVTRFHLRLHPRPRVIGFAAQSFPVSMLEQVYRWAHAAGPSVPRSVELQLFLERDVPGVRGVGITVFAPVFADGVSRALADLAFFTKGPLRRRAAVAIPFVPSGTRVLYRLARHDYPDAHRYAVDNMWTHAGIDALLPGLERMAATLPPAPSHVLWLNWAPPSGRPEMAFSLEDEVYLGLYSVWKNAGDDADFAPWPAARMREMAHLASGCQLADENLGERPARFVSEASLERLDRERARHDGAERFFPWMGRP